MRESPVEEAAPATVDGQRRCSSCDVTWWGDDATACWFCGDPGAFASDTRRVVRDESAA